MPEAWRDFPYLDSLHRPEIPPTYLVFIDPTDGLVKVKNGLTGVIDHQGADAATEINWALTNLTAGRTWKEKVVLKGNFTTAAPITVPSYTILEGGKLTLADGSNCDMINNSTPVAGNTRIVIQDCYLDCNKAGQTAVTAAYAGIKLENCTDSVVERCIVIDAYQNGDPAIPERAYGIFFISCDSCIATHNYVENCDYGGIGVYPVNAAGDSPSTNCIVTENKIVETHLHCGIQAYMSNATIIANNQCYDADENILLHTATYSVIEGNRCYGGNMGIHLYTDPTDNIVNDNHIYDTTTYGITVSGMRNVIDGNNISPSTGYGIRITYGVNTVVGNVINDIGTATDGIYNTTALANRSVIACNIIRNFDTGININGGSNNEVYGNMITGCTTAVVDAGTDTRIQGNEGNVGIYQTADYGVAWANWVANIVGVPANGTRCVFYNTNAGELNSKLGCYSNGAWVSVALA